MTFLLYAIHAAFHYLMKCILWPLSGLPPFWSLAVISFLTGSVMLWIFGKVSNQPAIKRVKNQIRANLLAVRLFDEHLSVFLKIEMRLLGRVLVYMKHSFAPMAVMLIPIFLLLVQLNLFYAARPLRVGESFLLKVLLPNRAAMEHVALEADTGVRVETPAVRIPSDLEIAWRLRAEKPGRHRMIVSVGDRKEDKEILVETGFGPLSVMRTAKPLDMLLYPGEPLLKESHGLRSIQVAYPNAEMSVMGWRINWLVVFFVLSIAFAFLMKGFFRVEI